MIEKLPSVTMGTKGKVWGARLTIGLAGIGIADGCSLEAGAVAVVPVGRGLGTQPGGGGDGEGLEGVAQRLADQVEPVERAHRRQDGGRVGPLPAARLDQPGHLAAVEQGVEQELLRPARHQPRAEVAKDGEVEAGVDQLQAQQGLSPQGTALISQNQNQILGMNPLILAGGGLAIVGIGAAIFMATRG